MNKGLLLFIFWWVGLLLSSAVIATTRQDEGLWLGLHGQNYIEPTHKWAYLTRSQVHFLNARNPLETVLTENSIGYAIEPGKRLWMGVFVADNLPNTDHIIAFSTWQQLYWKLVSTEYTEVSSRTRFSEVHFSNEHQDLFLWRQTLALEDCSHHFGRSCPFGYEEIFVKINRPPYAPHSFLLENRVFLGIIYHTQKHGFWKIGYMNIVVPSSTRKEPNIMAHILAITYIFGDRSVILPID